MKYKFKLIKFIAIATLSMFISINTASATYQSIETEKSLQAAYGLDTIAGYSTVLRTSELEANKDITFTIINPNGELSTIDATTSAEGIAITDLSDYYTQTAGEYQVSIENIKNYFTVFPEQVSDQNSTIYPNEQISTTGEKAELQVKISDKYQNPISGHNIKLISSSTNDTIKSKTETTDQNGEIIFEIKSYEKGINTYSIYDATINQTLSIKAKIIYTGENLQTQIQNQNINSNNKNTNIQISSIPKASYAAQNYRSQTEISNAGNSSGPIDHLKFEEIPETITEGNPFSMKITAYDEKEQKVMNYGSEIRFSVSGSSANYATVPEDYTFTAEDQGEHTFALAFILQQEGEYELTITDLNNLDINTKQTLTVTKESTNIANTSSEVSITNPTTGTYSTNTHLISGKAKEGAGIKIFDNEIAVTELVADLEGNFSYTTTTLTDGKHVIYAAEINEIGTILNVSKTITLTIDTSTPELGAVLLDKNGEIPAGSPVNIRVETENKLTSLKIEINSQTYELDYNEKGYYEGAFQAPVEFGEYTIDFLLEDELGNTSKIEKYAKFKVGASVDFDAKVSPPTVTKLIVKAEESKVSLKWNKVTKSANKISHYRVYYGLAPNELNNAIDTFTDTNQWYIPNLVNDQKYYFAVVAVDEKSNISDHFSNIAYATPIAPVVEVVLEDPEITNGTAGEDQIQNMEKDISETGTSLNLLILSSLFFGFIWKRVRISVFK